MQCRANRCISTLRYLQQESILRSLKAKSCAVMFIMLGPAINLTWKVANGDTVYNCHLEGYFRIIKAELKTYFLSNNCNRFVVV